MTRAGSVTPFPGEVRFAPGSAAIPEEQRATLDGWAQTLAGHDGIVYVHGRALEAPGAGELAKERAEAVKRALEEHARSGEHTFQLRAVGVAEDPRDHLEADPARDLAFLEARENYFPGEHGYRFFPAFYWHLFDTMRRTPILEARRLTHTERAVLIAELQASLPADEPLGTLLVPAERFLSTPRTVYDNLVPLSKHAVAVVGDAKPPETLSRQRIQSLEELLGTVDFMLEHAGFSTRDLLQIEWRLLELATASDARRDGEYAQISWADFLEAHRLSPRFQRELDQWPDALVAMSATECDARTQGEILLQLILDQTRIGYTDGTLNAPTSVAWLSHWKRYLEEVHDVSFVRGRLAGFEVNGEDEIRIRPRIEPLDGENGPTYVPGYLVVCAPFQELISSDGRYLFGELEELARKLEAADPKRAEEGAAGFFAALRTMDRRLAARPRAEPGRRPAPLQDFCGIQFFLEDEINWVTGHTYFPSSAWGLSAIAQTAFRTEHPDFRLGYRGILSVDIGIMDAPAVRAGGPAHGKTAWECTPDELAWEVWTQIVEALELRVPLPRYYHLDRNIDLAAKTNASPFLIPLVGAWDQRPGKVDEYPVHLDCVVVAGTFLRTHTRLTTMESANESARHAVNAILAHRQRALDEAAGGVSEGPLDAGARCAIWPLSDRELTDVKSWKAIDEALFERGLPHVCRSIDPLETLGHLLPRAQPRSARNAGYSQALLTLFRQALAAAEAPRSVHALAKAALKGT